MKVKPKFRNLGAFALSLVPAIILVFALVMILTACATKPVAVYPPRTDVADVITPKPKPSADILVDPAASDRHNKNVESWGDKLHAAGTRLCRYFDSIGMPDLDCPKANIPQK